jgi:hypothetical protein
MSIGWRESSSICREIELRLHQLEAQTSSHDILSNIKRILGFSLRRFFKFLLVNLPANLSQFLKKLLTLLGHAALRASNEIKENIPHMLKKMLQHERVNFAMNVSYFDV